MYLGYESGQQCPNTEPSAGVEPEPLSGTSLLQLFYIYVH